MNAIATTGGNSLVPRDMNGAMQLATMMSQGKLVPSHLQKSPGDCLMVIEQAMRWNMSPFAVAQCTSVIQGKLMFEGKLVAAAVQSSGILSGRLAYAFSGEGDKREVMVSGVLAGEAEPRTLSVAFKDARTTNQMWTKQPDQQLIYFGTRAWARRHTPEVMLGVYSPEEIDAAPDKFGGVTIDGVPLVRAEKAEAAPPRKPTVTEWLDALTTEMGHAQTQAEVDAILARDDVVRAQDALKNGAKERLQRILDEAIRRTSDDPPNMDGEAEFIDNDPANPA